MLHFQPSLPRLPIPSLQDTCTRYLNALAPVTSPEQLSRTQSIVAEFGREGGEGEGKDERKYMGIIIVTHFSQLWISFFESWTHKISPQVTFQVHGITCTCRPETL